MDSGPVPPQPPKDAATLFGLRDQLADYLAAVERNTDAVNRWLETNKEKIIILHHRLERAFLKKDQEAAVALLSEMGDTAGFILSLQDFRAKSETAFGKDNAFLKAASTIADSLPQNLQEPLPEFVGSEEASKLRIELETLPAGPEETKKWHSAISGWFNRDEKRKKEEDLARRRELNDIKAEILGLQSDRHYYIDGFMDWIVETMEPLEGAKPEAARDKMLQYKKPAYIIACAHADYREAVETRSRALRDAALGYAHLAGAIDMQDIERLKSTLQPSAYSKHYTEDIRRMLLQDYQSASLTELILKHIESRKDQADLLLGSTHIEKNSLAFSDATSPQDVFEKIMQHMLDAKAPLDPLSTLRLLQAFKAKNPSFKPETFAFKAGQENIFRRTAERFKDDIPMQRMALDTLLFAMGGKMPAAAANYVDLHDGLRQKLPEVVSSELKMIELRKSASEVLALAELCQPGRSLYEEILSVSDDPRIKGKLLEQAVQAGLLGTLRDNAAVLGLHANMFLKLFEDDILPALDKFPTSAARTLIAHTFSTGGLEHLRAALTWSRSWLRTIAASGISEQKKIEWIAVLLEPFKSDIVKANILAEAALKYTPNGPVADILTALEKNLIGENIRLGEDKILCNLHLIANIWYNHETRTVRYTMNGRLDAPVLLENVSPDMGHELLELLSRRNDFFREDGGLINLHNINSIEFGPREVVMRWFGAYGPVNIEKEAVAELKKVSGFLHAHDRKTGNPICYNAENICLLQPQGDGTTLLIDKYGSIHILTGDVSFDFSKSSLVPAGPGTWFNPVHAAIIRFDPDSSSFGFRVVGAEFENELDKNRGQFFYEVPVGDKEILKQLESATEEVCGPHPVEIDKASRLYFNMRALKYLGLNAENDVFYCHRYGLPARHGLIQIDAPTAAVTGEILETLAKQKGVIRLDDLLVHEDSIDTVHHDQRSNTLQFIVGREIHEFHAGKGSLSDDAMNTLTTQLQKKSLIRMARKDDVTDFADPDHITLVSYNRAFRGELHVTAQDLPIRVSATPADAAAFINDMDNRGLEKIRQETKGCAWTQTLSDTLLSFPVIPIRVSCPLNKATPQALLDQALGQAEQTIPGKFRSDFATVANLPSVGRDFSYPVENHSPQNELPKKKKKNSRGGPQW